MMGIIYDMANGRFPSPPAQDNTAPAPDAVVPALATSLQEPSPAAHEPEPHAHAIQRIRALLRKR